MNTLILKSTYKGLLDSLAWAICWAGLTYILWSAVDSIQMQAYVAWGVKSYAEVNKDAWGYSHGLYSSESIRFRHVFEWAVIIIGGIISCVPFCGFFYSSTRVTEVQTSDKGVKSVSWKQLCFPFSIEAKKIVFNRILSICTTQTLLQRVTGTETVTLTLLVMEGVNAKETEVVILGVPKLTNEQNRTIYEHYTDSRDVHKITLV